MQGKSWGSEVWVLLAIAALALDFLQFQSGTSASVGDIAGHVVTGGACRHSQPRFHCVLALRGGAWISEEEEVAEIPELEPAAAVQHDRQEMQAMSEDALDAFVEKCALEATQRKAAGGPAEAPLDMPYEDFVWTREFAEQGFDPLFMSGMTEEQAECARREWVSRIMDGEDDVDQLSEHYKNEGNRVVNEARKLKAQGNENYTKLHLAAIPLYTNALRQNASSIVHRAVCHANRANSHLERSNFGHAIRDCNATLAIFDAVARTSGGTSVWVAGCQARVIVNGDAEMRQLYRVAAKSAARAARACLRLNRFETAAHFCGRALEINARGELGGGGGGGDKTANQSGDLRDCNRTDDAASNKDTVSEAFVKNVRAMWEEADAGVARRAQAAARLALKKSAAAREAFVTRDALRKRGVLQGAPLYPHVLSYQQVDVTLQRDEATEADAVLWPLLMLYQEHGQSDFLRQCREDSRIQDHLLAVMDPELAPPPWDPARTLTPSSVSVYYISNQVPVLHAGKWRWLEDESGRRLPKEWVKVDPSTTVGELVRMPGHVVGQFPVLHLVASNSSFESHMLASDPLDMLPPLTVAVHDAG